MHGVNPAFLSPFTMTKSQRHTISKSVDLQQSHFIYPPLQYTHDKCHHSSPNNSVSHATSNAIRRSGKRRKIDARVGSTSSDGHCLVAGDIVGACRLRRDRTGWCGVFRDEGGEARLRCVRRKREARTWGWRRFT